VDRADEAALRCRKQTEKSKMAAKKAGLKKVRREEWRVQLEKLAKENPLVPYTDAGRTFSMVRRMKAEKKRAFPSACALVTLSPQKTERRRTR
jgi:hypothetical protein